MRRQAFEPAQLVVEFRAGRRIAVGQIEAADQHAVHRRLDIAAVRVIRIARQAAPGLDRVGTSREDGDAVPALLAVPDRAVAGAPDRGLRELLVRRLQLLQADHVRLGLASQRSRTGSRPLMPLTLKVAILIRGRRLPVICSSRCQHGCHPGLRKLRSIQVYRGGEQELRRTASRFEATVVSRGW